MVEHIIKLVAVFHLPFLFAHYIFGLTLFVAVAPSRWYCKVLPSLTRSVRRASLFVAKHNHTNTPNDAKDLSKLPRHTQWHDPSVHWDASQSSEGSEREKRGQLRDLGHGCRDLIRCLHDILYPMTWTIFSVILFDFGTSSLWNIDKWHGKVYYTYM